jgi:glucose/arabinose dehydrogenase
MKLSFWVASLLLLVTSPVAAEDPKRPIPIRATLVTDDLEHPSQITYAPGEPDRLYIVEREGAIRILQNTKLLRYDLLDIESHVGTKPTQGLLSVAFPSDYQTSKVFYVDLIDVQGDVVIGKFSRLKDEAAEWESLAVLMKLAQAFPNTNGSYMAFGPDSLLYISAGDGGGPRESIDAVQRSSSLFGKMLRINPAGNGTYTSPTDNPFVGRHQALPEIWALGFRNPRHFSFDRQTGRLLLTDQGDKTIELDRVGKGENFGWNEMEGTSCVRSNCNTSGFVPPLTSIQMDGSPAHFVGGFVYRASKIPELQGRYLFANGAAGQVYTLTETNAAWSQSPLIHLEGRSITAIGEDASGEPYIATDEGELFALIK